MSLHPSSARDALAAAQASRRRFALAQAPWPWSRHAAWGTLLAGLAAAQALPAPYNVATDAALAFAAAGIAASDRSRRGVFVNGWRHGRTLWITLTIVFVAIVVGLFGLWLSRERGWVWAPVAFGLGLIPVGMAASRLWEHVYNRELQESL